MAASEEKSIDTTKGTTVLNDRLSTKMIDNKYLTIAGMTHPLAIIREICLVDDGITIQTIKIHGPTAEDNTSHYTVGNTRKVFSAIQAAILGHPAAKVTSDFDLPNDHRVIIMGNDERYVYMLGDRIIFTRPEKGFVLIGSRLDILEPERPDEYCAGVPTTITLNLKKANSRAKPFEVQLQSLWGRVDQAEACHTALIASFRQPKIGVSIPAGVALSMLSILEMMAKD